MAGSKKLLGKWEFMPLLSRPKTFLPIDTFDLEHKRKFSLTFKWQVRKIGGSFIKLLKNQTIQIQELTNLNPVDDKFYKNSMTGSPYQKNQIIKFYFTPTPYLI